MKNKAHSQYEYFGVIALAVLSCVLHTFVYFEHYDFTKNLWQRDTGIFLKLASFLPLLGAILLGVVLVSAVKQRIADEGKAVYTRETLFSRIASGLVALSLVLTVLFQLLSIGSDNKLTALLDSQSKSYMALTATLHILTLMTACFAAGYFVFRLQKRMVEGLGIVALVYFVLYTLRMYFDMTMHINNPRWSFGVLTLVLLLLYFVFEIDQLFFSKKPLVYTVLACLALVSGFSYSVGEIAMAIGGKSDEGLAIIYPILILAASVYVASRLYTLLFAEAEKEASADTVAEAEESASDATGEQANEEAYGALCGGIPCETLPPEELTHDELKRFYTAIYTIVARKRGVGEDSDDEAKKRVRQEVLAMLSHLLEGDSRTENIEHMRAFLKRVEG